MRVVTLAGMPVKISDHKYAAYELLTAVRAANVQGLLVPDPNLEWCVTVIDIPDFRQKLTGAKFQNERLRWVPYQPVLENLK